MNSEQFNKSNTVFFLHDMCEKRKYESYKVNIKLAINERIIETQQFDNVNDIAFNYNMMIINMYDHNGNESVKFFRLERVVEWKAEVE